MSASFASGANSSRWSFLLRAIVSLGKPAPSLRVWAPSLIWAALIWAALLLKPHGVVRAHPAMPEQNQLKREEPWTYWIGHQVMLGQRRVPILGAIATRLDTYYLAKIRHVDGKIELVEETCRSHYAPIAGIEVRFPAQSLPLLHFELIADASGTWRGSTHVQWNTRDIDRDGQPGMSITVDATLCGGQIYVGSRTDVDMWLTSITPNKMLGRAELHHAFMVHDASSLCLRAFARNRREDAQGFFAFIASAEPVSCATLLGKPWPIAAQSPIAAQHPIDPQSKN